MCSTPRPRGKAKGASGAAGSILSTMDQDARKRFTERANRAQEQRDEKALIAKTKRNELINTKALAQKVAKKPLKTWQQHLHYWLFIASLKDILNVFFVDTAKRT